MVSLEIRVVCEGSFHIVINRKTFRLRKRNISMLFYYYYLWVMVRKYDSAAIFVV